LSNAYSIPILNYNETYNGSEYIYNFTLINDNISLIDELYIEFSLSNVSTDFISASSPIGWDYFNGYGQDLNINNNYWVGWTSWFGSELVLNQILTGFSISLLSPISGANFSWNWDRLNTSAATAPVPEPASILLFGTGIACYGVFKKMKRR
jgi:hypothetical protein